MVSGCLAEFALGGATALSPIAILPPKNSLKALPYTSDMEI